ncbi:oleate hydratase [Streptomyces sp. NBC_00012]
MTADTTYGDRTTVPELIRDKRDGSWRLWESIAKKAPDFGRPTAFCGNIDETKWESFTLTMTGSTLLDRIQEYTGNVPGEGALMTWKDSSWLLSVVVPAQAALPGPAGGHVHAVGIFLVRRRPRRPCAEEDGRLHRHRDPR